MCVCLLKRGGGQRGMRGVSSKGICDIILRIILFILIMDLCVVYLFYDCNKFNVLFFFFKKKMIIILSL